MKYDFSGVVNIKRLKVFSGVFAIFFLVLIAFQMFSTTEVKAAYDKVRVGLFSGTDNTYGDAAKTSYKVSASGGYQIGSYNSSTGAFNLLYANSSSDALTFTTNVTLLGQSSKSSVQFNSLKVYSNGSVTTLNNPYFITGNGTIRNLKNTIFVNDSAGNNILNFEPSSNVYLQVRPTKNVLNLEGKTYRGLLEFRRDSNNHMTVINELPMDQYLYGVLPGEIGGSSPMEALKAQAVTARTYAINNYSNNSLGFNLYPDVRDQVYGGYSSENSNCNKAVDATSGYAVYYGSSTAQVFYFASDGGWTEDVKNVWGSSFSYLISVKDEYENPNSYNYTWTSTMSVSTLKSKLGSSFNTVNSIVITKKSTVGRATEVVITGKNSSGTTVTKTLQRESCRTFFGLNSQWYTITTNKDSNSNIVSFTFKGRGWGHAVGMSQVGAIGYANHSYKYDWILQHYFPGTTLKKIY